MSDKRLHVITRYFYPVAAGIETNILETYSILASRGWDITIHTSKDIYRQKNVLPDQEMLRGLKIKRYRLGKFGFRPVLDWDQTDFVCLHNFDIFPHFQILAYSLLRKISGRKNYRLLVTPHGGFNPLWKMFPMHKAAIKYLYHRLPGVFLINIVVDGVRAVSDWERGVLIDWGISPKKVVTISNGLENEAYLDVDRLAGRDIRSRVSRWGKYLIQIGRIYPIKNYETVIRALPFIPREYKFIIVGQVEGSGKYLSLLKNLALKLGVSDRLIFAGVVRGVDKYYLIKHASLMVHMALWESYCNVVHEGLSQGLVCIVSGVYALPYLIKDGINGYCLPQYDYSALADKINYVLSHSRSREISAMRRRNRLVGRNESWSATAGKMAEYYLSI